MFLSQDYNKNDRLKADDVNKIGRSLEKLENSRGANDIFISRTPTGFVTGNFPSEDVTPTSGVEVYAANVGEDDLNIFDVAWISGEFHNNDDIPVSGYTGNPESFLNNRVIEIQKLPEQAESYQGQITSFCILKEDIPKNGVGRVFIGGVCIARAFREGSPAWTPGDQSNLYATPVMDKTYLSLNPWGGPFKVLWEETRDRESDVERFCLVQFDRPVETMAICKEAIVKDDTGSVALCYYDTVNSVYRESGDTFTALNIGPGDASEGDRILLSRVEGKQSIPFFQVSAGGGALEWATGLKAENTTLWGPDIAYSSEFDFGTTLNTANLQTITIRMGDFGGGGGLFNDIYLELLDSGGGLKFSVYMTQRAPYQLYELFVTPVKPASDSTFSKCRIKFVTTGDGFNPHYTYCEVTHVGFHEMANIDSFNYNVNYALWNDESNLQLT